jgi:hypothetical protein
MQTEVVDLTDHQAKQALNEIVNKLDLLDCNNYFGVEGWRKFMNIRSVVPERI